MLKTTAARLSGFFLLLILVSQCYPAKIVAPEGQQVRLASETESLSFKAEQRNWYVLYGLIPISGGNTTQVIRDNNLKTVRVETKVTFLDYVISAFTGIASVVTSTTVIEGAN